MAPQPTGTLLTRTFKDGTRAFYLRIRVLGERHRVILHERPGCACGCGGGWDEPAARTELGNILARVRVGVWTPPEPPPALAGGDDEKAPTFAAYAAWWLRAKTDGAIGEKPLAATTIGDYRWRLDIHLLPFFGAHRLDEIDADLCLAFKAHKLREAAELRAALDAGAEIRDHRGRRAVPLGASSVRKLIDTLAALLDDAIEDGHIDHNPARRKRMKVRVPKPKRTFLEMDELAALLDAASKQDAPLNDDAPRLADVGPTTRLVAHLLAQGKRPAQIAAQLGIARSTVGWHLRRLSANVGRGYVGRRVVCEILGRSGPRVSELCDLRIGHVRLHDRDGARFRIPDSKTETGVREVQMSPDLVEAVVEHLDRLRRAGLPTGPDDHLIPSLTGGRSPVSASAGSSTRPPEPPARSSQPRASRRSRTRRRTRCAAPTSRSRCWRTAST